MPFYVLDIPCAVFLFFIPVPIFQMTGNFRHRIRHLVIIAGFKSTPDCLIAHKMKHPGQVLQVFFTVLICGEHLFQNLQPARFNHGYHHKISDGDKTGDEPWQLIRRDGSIRNRILNADLVIRQHPEYYAASHRAAIQYINILYSF